MKERKLDGLETLVLGVEGFCHCLVVLVELFCLNDILFDNFLVFYYPSHLLKLIAKIKNRERKKKRFTKNFVHLNTLVQMQNANDGDEWDDDCDVDHNQANSKNKFAEEITFASMKYWVSPPPPKFIDDWPSILIKLC